MLIPTANNVKWLIYINYILIKLVFVLHFY